MRLHAFVLLLVCTAAVPTYGLIVIADGSAATERVSDIFLRCDVTGLISDDELVRVTWSYFDQSYNALVEIFQADLTSDQPAYLFSSKWAGRGQYQPMTFANIRLPYRYVTRDYSGDYRCEVESLMSRGLADVRVDVLYGPGTSITISPGGRVEKEERAELTLACSAQCAPQCTYRWYKAGRRISNTPTLTMTSVSRDDAGLYACQARNDVGRSIKPVDVRVRFSASVLTLNISGHDERTQQGGTNSDGGTFSGSTDVAVFTCHVRGWPEPSIVWSKSDSKKSNVQDISNVITTQVDLEHRKSLLEIKHPSCKDNGVYSCKTWNGLGLSSIKSAVLNISCPPYETNHSSICQHGHDIQVIRKFQENVQFHLCFFGNPIPSVIIRHADDASGVSFPYTGAITCEEKQQHCEAVFAFNISSPQQYGKYEAKVTNPNGYFEKNYHVISQQPPLVPSLFYVDNISYFSSCFSWNGLFNGGAKQTFSLKLYPHDPVTGERELGDQIVVNLFEEEETQNKDGNYSSKYYTCMHGLNSSTEYTAILSSSNMFGSSKYSQVITFTTLALATVEDNTPSLNSSESTDSRSTPRIKTTTSHLSTQSPLTSSLFSPSNTEDQNDYEPSTISSSKPVMSTSLSVFFKLESDDEDEGDDDEFDDENDSVESLDMYDVDMENFFQLFDAFFGIHPVYTPGRRKPSQDLPKVSNYSYHAHLKSLLQKYIHPIDIASVSRTEFITPIRINSVTSGTTESVNVTSTITPVTDLATPDFITTITLPATTVGVACVITAIFVIGCVACIKKRQKQKAAKLRYQQRLASATIAATRQIPPPIYCTPLPSLPCTTTTFQSHRNSVHNAEDTNECKPSITYPSNERTSAPNLPAPIPSDVQILRSKLKPNSSSPPDSKSPDTQNQPNRNIPVITVDNKRLSCPSYLDLYNGGLLRMDVDHDKEVGLLSNAPSTNFGDLLKPPSRNSSYTSINQTPLKHLSDDESSMSMSYLDLYEALSSRSRSRSPSNIYDPLQFESTHELNCLSFPSHQSQLCKQLSTFCTTNQQDEENYYPTYLESVPLKDLIKKDSGTSLELPRENLEQDQPKERSVKNRALTAPKVNSKSVVSNAASAETVPYEVVDLHLQKLSSKSVKEKRKSQKSTKKSPASKLKDQDKNHINPKLALKIHGNSNATSLFGARKNPFLIYLPNKTDEHLYDRRIPVERVVNDDLVTQTSSHQLHNDSDYVEIDTSTKLHNEHDEAKVTKNTHPDKSKIHQTSEPSHRAISHFPRGSKSHLQQGASLKTPSKDRKQNIYEIDGYVQEDSSASFKRDSAAPSWSGASSSIYNNELHLRHSGASTRKGTNSVTSKTSSGVSSMCATEGKRRGSYTKVTFDIETAHDRDSSIEGSLTQIDQEQTGDDTEEHIYAELPDIYDEINPTD